MQTRAVNVPAAEREPRELEISIMPDGERLPCKIKVADLDFYYGKVQALHNITLDIPERQVVAFIGPSGCGKSTFLRTLNRMNDTIPGTHAEGNVMVDGENIYAPGTDVVALRR